MYFVEKTKESAFYKRFDYYILIPVLVFCVIGMLIVKSAVLSKADGGARIMTMQFIGFAIGMILCLVISSVDYKDLNTLAFILYTFSVVLLLLVLIFGQGDSLGSRSWLNIGGVSFQPSEITKITFIIILAVYLDRMVEEGRNKDKNIFKLAFFAGFPILLILLQKDFGTTMVFIFILIMMLFVYGLQYRYFIIALGIGIVSSPLAWFFVLNENRRNRIRVFLDPEMDPSGASLNVIRSKMAIGSGQVFGKGLFSGPQTQNSAVPVKESDFIFSVIGEELGFVGAILIIALILMLVLRLTYIAMNAREPFGAFLVVGVCAMFCVHFIENIGMSIGLFPVTGIPLPFVSAGGSSLISNLIAIGIVLSVSMRRKKVIFQQ
jgi:rod shape determining protein RodA